MAPNEPAATHAPAAPATATPDAAAHAADKLDDDSGAHPHAHVVSLRLLATVFGALLLLTVLTVGVTKFDLGPFNIWVALGVAVLKAGLVAMYFMHLRWDSPFNGIIFIASLFFVALFIGIAIMDSKEYRVNYDPPGAVVSSNAQR